MDDRRARLQKKLGQKRTARAKRDSPLFVVFARWNFLAKHNRVLYENRAALSQLQADFEQGSRSAAGVQDAARSIVAESMARTSENVSPALKVRSKSGKELFNVEATTRQLWVHIMCCSPVECCTTPESRAVVGWECFLACRTDMDAVDAYFRYVGDDEGGDEGGGGGPVYQYVFALSNRDSALLFASKLRRGLESGRIDTARPVGGSHDLLAVTMAHTDNEQVKLGLIAQGIVKEQAPYRDQVRPPPPIYLSPLLVCFCSPRITTPPTTP